MDKIILQYLRLIADYQFGLRVGETLFPDDIRVEYSRKTGHIRRIYHGDTLLATLRPSDGFLALTLEGARRIRDALPENKFRVIISDEAVEFVIRGRDVFSKHVIKCDRGIIPRQEVLVEDLRGGLIAVGKAVLSGAEMGVVKRGVAVRVRESTGK